MTRNRDTVISRHGCSSAFAGFSCLIRPGKASFFFLEIGVQVIGFVRPCTRPEPGADKVAQNLLGGLTVLLIHGEKEEWQHQYDDNEYGRAMPIVLWVRR